MTATIKPTYTPTWATDTTVAGGNAEAGLDVRNDFGGTALAQGYVGGKRTLARLANWVVGGLCDWVAWLKESSGHALDRNTVTLTRLPVALAVSDDAPGATWNVTHLSGSNEIFLTQLSSDKYWILPLDDLIVTNALLVGVDVQCVGYTDWSALPSGMPAISVVDMDLSGYSETLGSAADTSATASAFKTRHTISLTLGTPLDLSDAGLDHFLKITGAADGAFSPVFFNGIILRFVAKPLT